MDSVVKQLRSQVEELQAELDKFESKGEGEPVVTEQAGIHEELMRRCIQLARHAKAQGNTAVGSVVVVSNFDGTRS